MERSSHYIMLVRLQNDHTAKRFAMVSSKRSVRFRHSFAGRPPGVTEPRWPNTTRSGFATSMDVFFCEQASPWQRGSNENSDGLLEWSRKVGLGNRTLCGGGCVGAVLVWAEVAENAL